MAKSTSINDFIHRFPDDAACLEHLRQLRFGPDHRCPKCGETDGWHRLSKLPAYTCNCGHHLHPMAGTAFERSHTPLHKWFYALFLFTTVPGGVSAKELQRQLGVTYKTAWRIAREIRQHMAEEQGGANGGDGGGSGAGDRLSSLRSPAAAWLSRGL